MFYPILQRNFQTGFENVSVIGSNWEKGELLLKKKEEITIEIIRKKTKKERISNYLSFGYRKVFEKADNDDAVKLILLLFMD